MYFPSVIELLVSIGLLAVEVVGFTYIVKRFPDPAAAEENRGSGVELRRRRAWQRMFRNFNLITGRHSVATRITVDPVTRIEGHLRIDCEVNDGKVTNAWSSGQMWRGIELILQGRDPRDAWVFTQRICGVCTTVHAMVSVRAVENALQLEIPLNAQYIRNMIVGAHCVHDHIVHFYHLSALDWVDVVSALVRRTRRRPRSWPRPCRTGRATRCRN